ncbi:MAG: hypothetical protein ABII27_09320, partial [bacterium]
MNHRKSKFSLIFRVIALMLLQAFLVMDIAWAAGGDFSVTEQKASASTLAPQLQLDAQTLKGVFSNTTNSNNQAPELTTVSKTQVQTTSKSSFLPAAVRNMVGAAIVFVMIVWPSASPALTSAAQVRAPPVQFQALPADIQKLSPDMQGLLESITRADKIKNTSKERDQTIVTGISKKGLAFTSGLARKRVVSINNWIEEEWGSLSKSGQLDEYTSRTIGTPEGDAVAKMKLLTQIANPASFEILKSTNAAIYMGDIPGAAYTTGAQLSGAMGRPLIYINKIFLKNIFWGAFALNHEAIHAGDIPQSYFGLARKYNTFTLFKLIVFSLSDPAEDKAYEAEYKFTSKFGIVPEKGNRFVNEFDLVGPYYNQRWNSAGYHLI